MSETKLYKVLRDGNACHGGEFAYPLPTGGKPGKWTPKVADLRACQRGYHVCDAAHLAEWLRDGSDYRIALVASHPALATPATVSPHGSGCVTPSPQSDAPGGSGADPRGIDCPWKPCNSVDCSEFGSPDCAGHAIADALVLCGDAT